VCIEVRRHLERSVRPPDLILRLFGCATVLSVSEYAMSAVRECRLTLAPDHADRHPGGRWVSRSAEQVPSNLYGEVDLERDNQLRAHRTFATPNRLSGRQRIVRGWELVDVSGDVVDQTGGFGVDRRLMPAGSARAAGFVGRHPRCPADGSLLSGERQEEVGVVRTGKFVIKRGRGGKTHFVLFASNV
jgi:hypothetical protein